MVQTEINNRMKILVTYAACYDMPARDGDKAAKGCSVQYFFLGENGEAIKPFQEWDISLPVGFQRNKVSLEYNMRPKLHTAPGIYWGEFKMTTGGDGKPVLKLYDVEFIEPFDISAFFAEPAAPEKPEKAAKASGAS